MSSTRTFAVVVISFWALAGGCSLFSATDAFLTNSGGYEVGYLLARVGLSPIFIWGDMIPFGHHPINIWLDLGPL